MNVLVACEESQRVCTAFREKGHNAFSCDILPCSGGHPEWHIMNDVLSIINPHQISESFYGIVFRTMNGDAYAIKGKWDLIIAHPPCTRLCNSGQRWLYWGDDKYRSQKIAEQQKAIVFFMMFVLADCDKIAIENPGGIMSTAYRKPDCVYNPYDFEGETECKKTCLWLKGLPPLKPTRKEPLPKEQRTQGIWKAHFGDKKLSWNDPETAKLRSQTPVAVAKAMADQWG
jgi:hypothetical protein